MTEAGLLATLPPADRAACDELLRRGSKSFRAASLLLPRRIRGAVSGMYAFCRVADDAIDDAPEPARGLEGLRERLDGIYEGRPIDHAVDRTFSSVARGFGIPRHAVEALLEGFAWDVEGRSYETLSDVRAYSARVASSVGVMMTVLMGPRDPTTLARACDLGVAMQLTNIARDVGEDARNGRLYLPRIWLREAGIDPERWLLAPRFEPGIAQAVERLLVEADRLYSRADAGIRRLPRDSRTAIRAARLIYSDIGRVIRRNGLDSVRSRAYTSKGRKLWLLARALLGATGRGHGEHEPALPETAFLTQPDGLLPAPGG